MNILQIIFYLKDFLFLSSMSVHAVRWLVNVQRFPPIFMSDNANYCNWRNIKFCLKRRRVWGFSAPFLVWSEPDLFKRTLQMKLQELLASSGGVGDCSLTPFEGQSVYFLLFFFFCINDDLINPHTWTYCPWRWPPSTIWGPTTWISFSFTSFHFAIFSQKIKNCHFLRWESAGIYQRFSPCVVSVGVEVTPRRYPRIPS